MLCAVLVHESDMYRAANNFFTWKDICPTKTPSSSDKTKLWSDVTNLIMVDFYSSLLWMIYDKILYLSRHHVWPHLGFRRTWANFGRPMADDRQLFAALHVWYAYNKRSDEHPLADTPYSNKLCPPPPNPEQCTLSNKLPEHTRTKQ